MDNIIIRPMLLSEAKEVAKVFKTVTSAITYYNDLAIKEELNHYKTADLKQKIKEDSYSILVAINDTKIVGYCITHFDCYTIWIDWFGVLNENRGEGIARAMLVELEKSIIERKAHKIWCDSRTDNVQSITLFKSLGYQLFATIPNHWYGQDFVLLQKSI